MSASQSSIERFRFPLQDMSPRFEWFWKVKENRVPINRLLFLHNGESITNFIGDALVNTTNPKLQCAGQGVDYGQCCQIELCATGCYVAF